MNADIQTVLRRTTPEALPEPDVATLRRRGLRRRAIKRTASVLSLALVLGGVGLGLALNRPAPVRFAEQAPAGWEELDLQAAVERLRDTARERAFPPDVVGSGREVHGLGVVSRGESTSEGTDEWLLPFRVVMRERDGGWYAADQREGARLQRGITVEQARETLAQETWSGEADTLPTPTESMAGVWRQAIEDAEHLATRPDPFVPSPGETERPDRVYAFMRLADAVRSSFDAEILDRGYGVIAALGEDWVEYRGLVTDLLGRSVVAFAAFDPANGSETVLLFDPETGRLAGEYDFLLGDAGPELLGGAAIEYPGW